jgi:hypothetical protein
LRGKTASKFGGKVKKSIVEVGEKSGLAGDRSECRLIRGFLGVDLSSGLLWDRDLMAVGFHGMLSLRMF